MKLRPLVRSTQESYFNKSFLFLLGVGLGSLYLMLVYEWAESNFIVRGLLIFCMCFFLLTGLVVLIFEPYKKRESDQ